MTNEDDFQRMLDANPADHHTRLVFADWLQDRQDPRAEGYRAMGECRLFWHGKSDWWVGDGGDHGLREEKQLNPRWPYRNGVLPHPWFRQVRGGTAYIRIWLSFKSRQQADDAVALAWGSLSEEDRERCRAELLAGEAVAA